MNLHGTEGAEEHMTEPPDHSDSHSAETCRAVIGEQFPAVRADALQLLSDAGDFSVFEVDGEWVFRFPLDDWAEKALLSEFALLDALGSKLPLPVPMHRFRGVPGDSYPRHFGGYARLPGQPGNRIDLPSGVRNAIAADLGRFLGELHRFDTEQALALGVPRLGKRQRTFDRKQHRALRELERREECLPPEIYSQCHSFLSDDSHRPPAYNGSVRLLHDDVDGSHVLVDESAGHVSGIIDWGDASVGDPARDFARLWMWQGDAFVATAMDEYRLPLDEHVWERVRYGGVCLALLALEHGSSESVTLGTDCLNREFGAYGSRLETS